MIIVLHQLVVGCFSGADLCVSSQRLLMNTKILPQLEVECDAREINGNGEILLRVGQARTGIHHGVLRGSAVCTGMAAQGDGTEQTPSAKKLVTDRHALQVYPGYCARQ